MMELYNDAKSVSGHNGGSRSNRIHNDSPTPDGSMAKA